MLSPGPEPLRSRAGQSSLPHVLPTLAFTHLSDFTFLVGKSSLNLNSPVGLVIFHVPGGLSVFTFRELYVQMHLGRVSSLGVGAAVGYDGLRKP